MVLACTNFTATHKLKLVVNKKSWSLRYFKYVYMFPCDDLFQRHS